MDSILTSLHFLYPYWLLLIPLLLLFFFVRQWIVLRRKKSLALQWDHFIDPQLQPYVLTGGAHNTDKPVVSHLSQWLWSIAALLAVIALAGPSLYKKQQPAYQLQQGLVIALDLSASMQVEDMKPNRLQRAKFKLIDLVQQRQEGQTGLVVFAAEAFSVSPLTTESTTLTAQIEQLTPDIMPAQGSRVDRAIEQAIQLLQQAGHATGDILLLTDGVANQKKAERAAKKAQAKHYTVSVIAFGTTIGGMIPRVDGGVIQDDQGERVISRLEPLSLEKIAEMGGGLYSEARVDNEDLELLMTYYKNNNALSVDNNSQQSLSTHVNEGIWLILPLIPLFLLVFRKGYLVLLLVIVSSQPQPVYAFEWAVWWQNDNQRAQQLFEQGSFAAAKQQFTDQHWQALSAYYQGDHQQAQQLFQTLDTAEAWYNQGTLLAKRGQFKEAVSALEIALQKQPEHQDAHYNLKLIQDHLLAQTVAAFDKQPTSRGDNVANKNKDNKQQKNQSRESEQQKNADNDQAQQQAQQLDKPKPSSATITPQQQQEQDDFSQQWLRSIPDDPSGLWRRKFKYQYQQRSQVEEKQRW